MSTPDPTPPTVPVEALAAIARSVVEQSPRYIVAMSPDVPDPEARDAELALLLLNDPRFTLTATSAYAAGVAAGRTAAATDIRSTVGPWSPVPTEATP